MLINQRELCISRSLVMDFEVSLKWPLATWFPYVLFEGLKSLEQPWRRPRVRPTFCFTFLESTGNQDTLFFLNRAYFVEHFLVWLHLFDLFSRLSPQDVEIRFSILVRRQVFAICPMTLSNPLPEAKCSDPFFSDWSPTTRIISSEGFTISTALSKLYWTSDTHFILSYTNYTFG